MKNLILFRKEPSMPDFAAFEAEVRTRVPQSRALPAEAIVGVKRIGRLVHVLRIRHGWTLRELETRTGLAWLWLALLEHGVLLPSELTEEAVEKLGQAFPPRGHTPNPGALFRALAEHLQGLKLPKAHGEEGTMLQEPEQVAAAPGAGVREEAAGVLQGMTAAAEMVKSAFRRLLPVELWTGPREALASPTPAIDDLQEFVVYLEELRALGVEPYIRIDLLKEPKRHTVSFLLEPLVDPTHPGRPLEPQTGTVEIRLLRPTPKASLTARLGSRNVKDFRDFSPSETLDDYSEGEERQWQAEVTVVPGATWRPS